MKAFEVLIDSKVKPKKKTKRRRYRDNDEDNTDTTRYAVNADGVLDACVKAVSAHIDTKRGCPITKIRAEYSHEVVIG